MTEFVGWSEEERSALETLRSAEPRPSNFEDPSGRWVAFGLRSVLRAAQRLRAGSVEGAGATEHKADGSPATALEVAVEEELRGELARFEPGANFVGEESGGAFVAEGWTVALDPVDGTWAFLNETPSWCCSLAVFRDGEAFAGFLANPATGEIAYATATGPARYLRVSTFGEPHFAKTLRPAADPDPRPLVNLHPSRATGPLQEALQAAWARDEIRAVRAPGGSPSWSLVEVARGHYGYVNLWSSRPARAYDLAPGTLLVRRAGGEVRGLDGAPIDANDHVGPWVATIVPAHAERLLALLRKTLAT